MILLTYIYTIIYIVEHSIFFNSAKLRIMQDKYYRSEILDDRKPPSPSSSILEKARTLSGSVKGELYLQVVCDERKIPVSNAMISIDSIGLTAVCDQDGKVFISNLLPGRYSVDVICAGYVARSVLINIEESALSKLQVKMTSNI